MVFGGKEEKCPICGVTARVSRKWVINRYGKRYDYFIYHHQGVVHYFNQDSKSSKGFRKGDLEKILIETINSQGFKLGSFQVVDIKRLLLRDFPKVGFGSIKVTLNRLAEIGILEKQKKGRNLFFVNTVSKERLSYVIESLTVVLEDVDSNATFKRHVFDYNIKNDHSWPLYYIPFRAVGDVETGLESLELTAFDSKNNKDIKVMHVEDAPKDKRVLLMLSTPLFPGDFRTIRIQYDWSEPKQMFVYSSATKMKIFEFSLYGNYPNKLSVFLTSASSNETTDLSSAVKEMSSPKWSRIRMVSLADVEAFAVLQLKWR